MDVWGYARKPKFAEKNKLDFDERWWLQGGVGCYIPNEAERNIGEKLSSDSLWKLKIDQWASPGSAGIRRNRVLEQGHSWKLWKQNNRTEEGKSSQISVHPRTRNEVKTLNNCCSNTNQCNYAFL